MLGWSGFSTLLAASFLRKRRHFLSLPVSLSDQEVSSLLLVPLCESSPLFRATLWKSLSLVCAQGSGRSAPECKGWCGANRPDLRFVTEATLRHPWHGDDTMNWTKSSHCQVLSCYCLRWPETHRMLSKAAAALKQTDTPDWQEAARFAFLPFSGFFIFIMSHGKLWKWNINGVSSCFLQWRCEG